MALALLNLLYLLPSLSVSLGIRSGNPRLRKRVPSRLS